MAEKPRRKRRLRWLVLAGLGGIGVYLLRSRRSGTAALLEQWPAAAPEPAPQLASVPTRAPVPPTAPSSQVAEPEPVAPRPAEEPAAVEPATVEPAAVEPPVVEPPAVEPVAVEPPAAATSAPEPAAPHPIAPPTAGSTLGGQALFTPVAPTDAEPAPVPTVAELATRRPSPKPRHRAGPAPVRDHGPGSAEPLPDGSAPGPEYTIKGNADSMLFHRPDSPYFTRTRAEVWFRTATDARAAGFTEAVARKRAED